MRAQYFWENGRCFVTRWSWEQLAFYWMGVFWENMVTRAAIFRDKSEKRVLQYFFSPRYSVVLTGLTCLVKIWAWKQGAFHKIYAWKHWFFHETIEKMRWAYRIFERMNVLLTKYEHDNSLLNKLLTCPHFVKERLFS